MQSLEANFGLTQQQAVDQAAVLLNSGLGAQTIQDLAEKAGPVGGQELFARLLAARGEVNLGRAGRSLPTLISALNRRDETGGLASDLTSVGITEDQTMTDRIDLLAAAVASGQISQGQFENAIGGAQNLRLFSPLARARGGQAMAEQALLTGTAVGEVEKLRQSEYVRIAERQQQRELRLKLAEEAGGGSAVVERIEDVNTGLQEQGWGSYVLGLGAVMNNPAYVGVIASETVQKQQMLDQPGASPFVSRSPGGVSGDWGGSGVVINNYGTTIHNGRDPLTTDLNQGRPRR